MRKLAHIAFFDPVFEQHARTPAVLDAIEALLRTPDLKLYQDQLFMKPPRVGSRQGVHQDQPLGFDVRPGHLMVTSWVALDPSTVESGCVMMQPRTHRGGVVTPEARARAEAASLAGTATPSGRSSCSRAPYPFTMGTCYIRRRQTRQLDRGRGSQHIMSVLTAPSLAQTRARTTQCWCGATVFLGLFDVVNA